MRPSRMIIWSLVVLTGALLLASTPALAQSGAPSPSPTSTSVRPPTPQPTPGLCAPWHKCAAVGMMGLVVLYLLFLAAMYGFQRRGFDRVEHRQGNPEGVPVKTE